MNTTKRYSPEVRERAVRLVIEQRGQYPSLWAAICSIAGKIGLYPRDLESLVQTRRRRSRSGRRVDFGSRTTHAAGTGEQGAQACQWILRQAAAFFARAELDRKPK